MPAACSLTGPNLMTHFVKTLFRRLTMALGLCALILVGGAVAAQEGTESLKITTAGGAVTFQVEVMRTDAQRGKGLMFRRYMPDDRGMLFDFKQEQPVSMWMRNTYLPLDMIFITKTGKILSITENTEPLSDAIISSNGPAFGVLEVNAGLVARHGIKVGDQVDHALFVK